MLKRASSTVAALTFAVFLTGCASQPGDPGAESRQVSPAAGEPAETSSRAQGVGSTNDNLRTLSGSRIAVRIGDKAFTIQLYNNPTAKDLVSQLPLTLTADDYPGYDEKVVRVQNPLSMEGAPDGDEPAIPEVGYYEPGQWIALYYGPIGYWPGKVPLGRIDASVEELRAIPDGASVTIEVVKN
ncbi:cyclophilin-like fold protein [Nonomuraea sp. NPDC005650]|uniref:cyclophilin-like fold protein n=1 Tax=Nonomuraea sp. NPDC005650 TaxID=3157045 RepID=UPI0033AE02A7